MAIIPYTAHYPEEWYEGPLTTITVGASPFTWQNIDSWGVRVFIHGGTVTTIEYKQYPWIDADYQVVGLLAGMFDINPLDTLRVTYVVAPTMTATAY